MGTKPRLASKSFGRSHPCTKPWPENCFVQCGDSGIVLGTKGSLAKVFSSKDPLGSLAKAASAPETYITAFFEAFPRNPSTFIRGEGKTIEEAEQNAWDKLEKYKACKGHEYEKRGYKNGAGFCKHCNMFSSHVFPEEKE